MKSLVNESIKFFEQNIIGLSLDEYLCMESISDIYNIQGDFSDIVNPMINNNMANMGKSYDNFIAFRDCGFSNSEKYVKSKIFNIDTKYVKEHTRSHFYIKNI